MSEERRQNESIGNGNSICRCIYLDEVCMIIRLLVKDNHNGDVNISKRLRTMARIL